MQESGTKIRSNTSIVIFQSAFDSLRFITSLLSIKQPDGYGCEQYPDGSVYGGQFADAQRHGVGRFQNKDYYYAGQWKKGLRNGVGVELECDEDDELKPRLAIYIMWNAFHFIAAAA